MDLRDAIRTASLDGECKREGRLTIGTVTKRRVKRKITRFLP